MRGIVIQAALFVAVLVPFVYFTMKLVRREREIPSSREGAQDMDLARAAGYLSQRVTQRWFSGH